MLAWSSALGLITFVRASSKPAFTVRLVDATRESGSTMWSSGDSLNGRNPNPGAEGNTLIIKDTDTVGTIVHELGHLPLGALDAPSSPSRLLAKSPPARVAA